MEKNYENFNIDDIKNIKISSNPSLEEKIDYIYKTLKYQQRMKAFFSIIKVLIFLGILYLFLIYIPSLPPSKIQEYQEKASNFMRERVTKIITPIIKEMTEDMIKDINMEGTSSSSSGQNISEAELNRKMEILRKMGLEN